MRRQKKSNKQRRESIQSTKCSLAQKKSIIYSIIAIVEKQRKGIMSVVEG
jgi:hypothetical protein